MSQPCGSELRQVKSAQAPSEAAALSSLTAKCSPNSSNCHHLNSHPTVMYWIAPALEQGPHHSFIPFLLPQPCMRSSLPMGWVNASKPSQQSPVGWADQGGGQSPAQELAMPPETFVSSYWALKGQTSKASFTSSQADAGSWGPSLRLLKVHPFASSTIKHISGLSSAVQTPPTRFQHWQIYSSIIAQSLFAQFNSVRIIIAFKDRASLQKQMNLKLTTEAFSALRSGREHKITELCSCGLLHHPAPLWLKIFLFLIPVHLFFRKLPLTIYLKNN